MPAFSFSAPRFSAEDELREHATLTEDEQLQIANDLMGNSNESHPELTPEDVHFALEQFHSELDLIPDNEKSSVVHAMREAPELVQRESNPMLFLRAEAFDSKVRIFLLVKRSAFSNPTFLMYDFLRLRHCTLSSIGICDNNYLEIYTYYP